MTDRRLSLTLIWIASLGIALVALELYVQLKSPEGKFYLLPEDEPEFLKPVLLTYGSYLTGILGFWFLRPLSKPATNKAAAARFVVALVCTILFNLLFLYFITRAYFSAAGHRNVLGDVAEGTRAALFLAFIVAPVNLFYFGAKQ